MGSRADDSIPRDDSRLSVRSFDEFDAQHLRLALAFAELGRYSVSPNPLVGAVVARGAHVRSVGWHMRYGDWHAERVALNSLADIDSSDTLYVTLEPCSHSGKQPPCTELIIERGIRRVVLATGDPNPQTSGIGPSQLEAAGIHVIWAPEDISRQAQQQNHAFRSVHVNNRPWLTYKWAMGANGRVATGDPSQPWISSPTSRAAVHELRALHDAILVGVGTVLADDPALTIRSAHKHLRLYLPLRVVLDRTLRTPPDSQLVRTARSIPTVIFAHHASAPQSRAQQLQSAGVEVVRCFGDPVHEFGPDLMKRGVSSILAECGPTLAHSLWGAALIDELICFQSPETFDESLPGFASDSPLVTALHSGFVQPIGRDTVTRTRL